MPQPCDLSMLDELRRVGRTQLAAVPAGRHRHITFILFLSTSPSSHPLLLLFHSFMSPLFSFQLH